jgi:hypothetical protein
MISPPNNDKETLMPLQLLRQLPLHRVNIHAIISFPSGCFVTKLLSLNIGSAATTSATLVNHPAQGDDGDAKDEANELEDVVGLDTLATTYGEVGIVPDFAVRGTIDVVATTIQQLVVEPLADRQDVGASAAVDTLQRDCQGLVASTC